GHPGVATGQQRRRVGPGHPLHRRGPGHRRGDRGGSPPFVSDAAPGPGGPDLPPPPDPTRWPTQQRLVVTALGRNGDGMALVDDAGGWTGRELRGHVARLARAMGRAGVGAGARVALLGGNSSWFAAAQLAT